MERIIWHYWYHLSIVDRVGRYYGTPLKVHRRVTQGDPLSLTILNTVVDVVIHHWVMLVTGEEAVPDGFRWAVQWLAAFFHANDGIILRWWWPSCPAQASPDPSSTGCLHGTFLKGGPPDQCKHTGWYGVSSLKQCCRSLGGGIYVEAWWA